MSNLVYYTILKKNIDNELNRKIFFIYEHRMSKCSLQLNSLFSIKNLLVFSDLCLFRFTLLFLFFRFDMKYSRMINKTE
jgi:hypothetical protein